MKQQIHLWLDIALAAPATDPEREVRVRKALRASLPVELAGKDWNRVRSYSRAIGAWAMLAPSLEEWMPGDLVDSLRALAPDPVGNPEDFFTLTVKQFLVYSEARLDAEFRPGVGIEFTVNSTAPLHALTTAQWMNFVRRPYRIQVCEHCGAPFTPQRKTAHYCSQACRQAAHVVRKAPTTEQISEAKKQRETIDQARDEIARMLNKDGGADE